MKPQAHSSQPVRVLPMSVDHSDNCTIEEQQNEYFLGRLRDIGGEYRCRQKLNAEPGTTVLFQYRGHVIASATYLESKILRREDRYGYTCSMFFDPVSIRAFTPVDAQGMKRFWSSFRGFGRAKLKLSSKPLRRFFASLDSDALTASRQVTQQSSSDLIGRHLPTTRKHVRRGSDDVEVSRDHARMQHKLHARLVRQHGANKVRVECNGVDLCVLNGRETVLYEIKPFQSARAVIREALGQLVEYAFFKPDQWKGARLRLVIVGRTSLDASTRAYLRQLQRLIKLPMEYQVVSI